MLRNEILYCLDNTARILDVRHLPNTMVKNDVINETQWEAILRSLSAYRAYMWQNQNELNAITYHRKNERYYKITKNNKVKNNNSFNLNSSSSKEMLRFCYIII